MDLVTPGIGLVFWTTVTFLLVVFLLIKFAWKPVLGMINERNKSIEDALQLAEKTKAEMAQLQADNERIIAEARKERDNLLKEAREMKDQMIAQAKAEASAEGLNRKREKSGYAGLEEPSGNTLFRDCRESHRKRIRKQKSFR